MSNLQNTQEVPQLIIKGNEIAELNQLLDTMTHGDAKKIISFINQCQSKRSLEKNQMDELGKKISGSNEAKEISKLEEKPANLAKKNNV